MSLSKFQTPFVLLVFLGVSALLNFRSENILEPDSFYHIRHAWIYRTNNVFDSSFPWTQFSVIRTAGADLWYGFHIFLVPFTYISNLVLAIKVAAFFITFLVLISCYAAFRNIKIKHPEFWAFIFLFASPSIMARMTFTRPHPLSLGLTALIFSFLYNGSAVWVFVFSFLLSWFHSAVFWIPLITFCFIALVDKIRKRKTDALKFIALFAGTMAGFAARPHPIANLKLIYVQIVDLYLSKGHELAQIIGAELRSPTWNSVNNQKWLFAILIVALIYAVRRFIKKESLDHGGGVVILSSLALTAFSVIMYATAKRAIDQLGLFIIIFAGSVFSLVPRKRLLWSSLIILLLAVSVYNIAFAKLGPSHSPNKFKESALWLKENTNKEDTVFYLNWGYFPFLFFWNQSNYYINGMDPVFLLKYDEKLFWKSYNMAVNGDDKKLLWKLDNMTLDYVNGVTCGYDPKRCRSGDIEAIPDVLRNDFHASYVFVLTQTKGFSSYLAQDKKNFQKVFEDQKDNARIYKVLPE